MKILIISGEASGDLHGSCLAKELIIANKDIELFGVGGASMKEAGVRLYFDIDGMGIVGAVEIIGKFSFLKRVYDFLLSKIKSNIFDAVVLIDYPTLNLRLAKAAKKRGIPVFYYISPQVWAWRKGRVKQIKKNVDRMITILPFEKGFYQNAGVDVEFVGHPFVDIVTSTLSKEEAYDRFGLVRRKKIISLFPGSRKHELDSILPVMLSAASLIKRNYANVQFLLALAGTVDRRSVEQRIANSFVDVKIVEEANYDVMNVSDFLIMTSGSATLEASFFAVPMVIVYKANFFTFMAANMLVNVHHIGLVNIVGGETIVPELIQYDVTPLNIATETLGILNDRERYLSIKKGLQRACSLLGREGACKRAAGIIMDYLKK